MSASKGVPEVLLDYAALLSPEEKTLFSLRLYGPGERTRRGSVSPEETFEAFQDLAEGRKLLIPHQIHGKDILVPGETKSFFPQGDGILLDHPSSRGILRFADCCPVVLLSREPVPWMVMMHMGYRGALENIPGEGVRRIARTFPSADVRDLMKNARAFVGPAIRGCCYFRREEDPLTLRGRELFPEILTRREANRTYFDLSFMGRALLERAGVPRERIMVMEECVCCGPSRWYSYRRGDAALRNVLWGGLK